MDCVSRWLTKRAYFFPMHGKFIMLIPISEATWQEVHMHFIS